MILREGKTRNWRIRTNSTLGVFHARDQDLGRF
jgi:hypothetical protein